MGQRESKPNNPLKSILISREAMERLKALQALYKEAGYAEAGKLKGFLEFLIQVEYKITIEDPGLIFRLMEYMNKLAEPATSAEPETGNKFF